MTLVQRLATSTGISGAAGVIYYAYGLNPAQAGLSALLALGGTLAALVVPLPSIGGRRPPGTAQRLGAPKGLADLVREARDSVARLRRAARKLTSDEATAPVLRIADAADEGLGNLAKRGFVDPLARQILAYYLPETVKLAEALHALEGMRTPDVDTGRTVVAALKRLENVFFKFADAEASADVSQLQRDLRLLQGAMDRLQDEPGK